MKTYQLASYIGLFLLLGIVSCKKDQVFADCDQKGAFVKEVKNEEGRIHFDSTQNKYMALVPNSMDSYDVGYVCDLPLKFQKAALAVRFSGRYFEYDKPAQGIAGNKYYYLSLEEITEK
jgi:hypothetical protein